MNNKELPVIWNKAEEGLREFCLPLIACLEEFLPRGTRIENMRISKNNSTFYDAICIREPGENCMPVIPAEPYYERFLDGTDFETITEMLLKDYEEAKKATNFDTSNLRNYEWIRQHIGFKLVNYEKNKEMLKDMPHAPFLDLTIVIFVDVADMMGVPSTFMVHNAHMRDWNVEADQLVKEAMENMTRKIPARLRTMMGVLNELNDGGYTDGTEPPMYILTNESRCLGAGCVLYHGVLQACAKKLGKEFYLLPSSIHEMILIPCDEAEDPGMLICMVRDINRTQVLPSEILSDYIYKYDGGRNILSMLDMEQESVIVRSQINLTQMDELLLPKSTNLDGGNAIILKEEA